MASKRLGVPHTGEDDELRVPLMEERLRIEKRTRSMGEAVFHRRVTEERRSAEVDVMREHLRAERRGFTPRPAQPSELEGAFSVRTIRVPVFGETAVARKAPYVTGEVVVHRRRVAETRALTETVRRERAEVEEVAAPQASPPNAAHEEVPLASAPALPIRKVLDDVRAGWARARRAD